jgi:phosphate:Na+ symporter
LLSCFNFLAGIALMLFGIRSLRKGTDRVFGSRFRQLVHAATAGSFRAMLAGFLISILAPSSTAMALFSVEALSGGYATLRQILALMLGANVGFTITVQLLAFQFYIYNAVFIAVGVPLYLLSKRQHVLGTGQALFGVGFLLLAIQTLSTAVAPIRNNADVLELIRILENHPLWLILFGVLLQVATQSSTTTIGIGIALCSQQVIHLPAALDVVIGANIGIGITSLLAGVSQAETRRMAVGILFVKLVGTAILIPLLPEVIRWLEPLSFAGPTHDTQLVANVHTAFNVALALVFLPLVPWLSLALERWIPAGPSREDKDGARYLDLAALESPPLALGQATREILHMADIVREMLRSAYRCFQAGNETLCEKVQQEDDRVDSLNNEIKAYLTRMSEQALNPEDSRREVALLTFATELETIGDIIDKNLADLARKKITTNVEFSREGAIELDGFFHKVLENFEIAVSAFASQDKTLANQLLERKREINELERDLRNRHFQRLRDGLTESFETSAIHLDVLTNLKAINSHLTAVAYPILENGPAG